MQLLFRDALEHYDSRLQVHGLEGKHRLLTCTWTGAWYVQKGTNYRYFGVR